MRVGWSRLWSGSGGGLPGVLEFKFEGGCGCSVRLALRFSVVCCQHPPPVVSNKDDLVHHMFNAVYSTYFDPQI